LRCSIRQGAPAPPPRGPTGTSIPTPTPLELVPFAEQGQAAPTIDAAARARDPRVAQVSVSLSGSWSVVEIVRADGFTATDMRPLVRLNVSIIAGRQRPPRDRQHSACGGRYLYDGVMEEATWNRAIDEALANRR
jgi:TldD protein